MVILQIVAGSILGLGVILTVFWITFRQPPPRRPIDSTTSIAPNSDAEYLIVNSHDHDHSGHF